MREMNNEVVSGYSTTRDERGSGDSGRRPSKRDYLMIQAIGADGVVENVQQLRPVAR